MAKKRDTKVEQIRKITDLFERSKAVVEYFISRDVTKYMVYLSAACPGINELHVRNIFNLRIEPGIEETLTRIEVEIERLKNSVEAA